ncbi:MAG: RnfABCDGE type electron transport complex subunit G [Oligosphaeraceae bacterium]
MKEILKLALSLTFICALAGASLAFVSARTEAPRKEAKEKQRNEKMALLLPPETARTELCQEMPLSLPDGTEVTFFQATDAQGKILAFCAEASDPSGFGGEVKLLVGIAPDGTVRGVLVTENAETPGIGSRVCERQTSRSFWDLFRNAPPQEADGKYPPNEYLDRYESQLLPAEGFVLKAEEAPGCVRPISGATISSRAVVNAVNRVCLAWHAQKARLLSSQAIQE